MHAAKSVRSRSFVKKSIRYSAVFSAERLEGRRLLTAIVSGQTVPGTIAFAGQEVSYTFSAIAGESFRATVGAASAGSAIDPYMTVYAPSGSEIGASGGNGVGTSAQVNEFSAASGGTYTIVVQDYRTSASGGAYELELVGAPATQAANAGGNGGAITSGQTDTGTLNHYGDMEVYTFAATAGESFRADVGAATAGSTIDPYLTVYGPDGSEVSASGGNGVGTSAEVNDFSVTRAGTYTIVIQDSRGTNIGGTYDLEVVGAPATQAANAGGNGGAITSGQTDAGTLNHYGDMEVYTFAATTGESFRASVGAASAGSTIDPYLTVYGPDGSETGASGGDGVGTAAEVNEFSVSKAGTYTLVIQDYRGTNIGGTYDLEVAGAPATQAANAGGNGGVIANDQTETGTINHYGDMEVYTFSASKGDSFRVSVGVPNSSSTFDPYLTIYDPSGNEVSASGGNGVGVAAAINDSSVAATGTYTIVVQDYHSSNLGGTYNVELTGVIHSVAPTLTAVAPAAQTADAGTSKSFLLGSFTASNATAPYTATVVWGDGTANTTIKLTAAGTIPATAHTYAKAGTDTASVSVVDSASHSSNKATFVVTVSSAVVANTGVISGTVFNDANLDKKLDDNELGLGEYVVFIDLKNTGTFAAGDPTATTAVNGTWSFTSLAAGTYKIAVEPVTGSALTTSAELTVTIAASATSIGNLFGEKAIAA